MMDIIFVEPEETDQTIQMRRIWSSPYCKSTATMIETGLLSYIRPVHEVITSGLDETFARSDLIAYSALLDFLILQVFGTPV
ncbi:hypothetical protein CI770_25135 [Shigella sonnei]|nr:hypothetical protein CI770_25135 [Shigella sonnei]